MEVLNVGRLLGADAQRPQQPLVDHRNQTAPHEERLDLHLNEPRHGRRGRVGVKGGQQQLAGERSLDGELRRIAVADLADDDHLGILSHQRTQAGLQIEAGSDVHLALRDALDRHLDRVLDRHDAA